MRGGGKKVIVKWTAGSLFYTLFLIETFPKVMCAQPAPVASAVEDIGGSICPLIVPDSVRQTVGGVHLPPTIDKWSSPPYLNW